MKLTKLQKRPILAILAIAACFSPMVGKSLYLLLAPPATTDIPANDFPEFMTAFWLAIAYAAACGYAAFCVVAAKEPEE